MAADAIDLADVGARAQQLARELALRLERQPLGRHAGERGGAAAQQHQHEVVRPGLLGEAEQPLARGDAAPVRDRMAAGHDLDPAERPGRAVRGDGEAGERTAPPFLDDPRHRHRRLAERKQDGAAGGRLGQMPRQHALREAGRNARPPDRFNILPRTHHRGLAACALPDKP